MTFAKGLLYVSALIFVGIGVLYVIAPTALVAVFDVCPGATAVTRTELRAVYGGIELALGIWFAMAARSDVLRYAGALTAGFVSLGAGLGRVYGIAVEQLVHGPQYTWAVLEVVGGIVAFIAARGEARRSGAA